MPTPPAITATQPPNFLVTAHRGLRNGLFRLAVEIGSTDAEDADAVAALGRTAGEVVDLLRHHTAVEDEIVFPIVAVTAREAVETARADHIELDAALDDLASALADVTARADEPSLDRAAAAVDAFLSRYLGHLAEEEARVVPATAACDPVELAAAHTRIVTGMTVDQLVTTQRYTLPALSPRLRRAVLAGGRRVLEPDVFAAVADALREALPPDVYADVAAVRSELAGADRG